MDSGVGSAGSHHRYGRVGDAGERRLQRLLHARLPVLAAALGPWAVGAVLSAVSWVEPGAVRSVALVQGNVDQAVKWLPENQRPIIDRYRALSEDHWGVDVMVWPEAAITVMAHDAGDVLGDLEREGERSGTGLVLGLPAVERLADDRIVLRNTAIAIGDIDSAKTIRGRPKRLDNATYPGRAVTIHHFVFEIENE